ncbi:MAG: hypothetical protein JW704_13630 [Anaerolineaceae bacterium]|nr:hypothetical protein [Anaerolineaceae bacterium]
MKKAQLVLTILIILLSQALTGAASATPVSQEDSPGTPEILRLPDGSVDCAAYQDYTGFEPAAVAEACNTTPAQVRASSSPLAPTDIGYAQEISYISGNFVSFALNNFTGQTVIDTNTNVYFGMDFNPAADILYALNETTDELGTIDLTTGDFTSLVSCPPGGGAANWTGLSIDPVTGAFYGSTATNLYTINSTTGTSTLIGSFGSSTMIDIAINMAGEMYGHDIGTDSIYSINMTTGAATLIGPTGYDANYAQGMDFDNDDGTLYIFLLLGTGVNHFGTVNLTTGAVTSLASDAPTGEFEGAIQVPGVVPVEIYLPLVLKPYITPVAPVLNAISNADGDGNYNVSWGSVAGAATYTLQEDDNAGFSSPTTAYSGSGTSRAISGKDVGTYYYRVNASNASATSGWSNTQSVVVTVSPPACPQAGAWSGTTSQGRSISFTVENTPQCQIAAKSLVISIRDSCYATHTAVFDPSYAITSNHFSAGSASSVQVIGDFTSLTTASGTFSYTMFNPFPPPYNCTASGTWTAAP